MEDKKEKMTKEEQIKIIDDLIDDIKKYQDNITKAIKDLGDSVHPRVLEDLGYMYSSLIEKQAKLECIKDLILNQGLGNEYAERAFGVIY